MDTGPSPPRPVYFFSVEYLDFLQELAEYLYMYFTLMKAAGASPGHGGGPNGSPPCLFFTALRRAVAQRYAIILSKNNKKTLTNDNTRGTMQKKEGWK